MLVQSVHRGGMLRSLLISLSNISWAQRFITRWGFAWRVASRFIAGETRQDAIRVVRDLNAAGLNASVDFLGENVSQRAEAENAVSEVLSMLEEIHSSGVRSNISVKLSQMGLNIDVDFCRVNMSRILQAAGERGNFIRIDMEDSSMTRNTIGMYTWLREQGFENVGIVIQAYLYRSEEDLQQLNRVGARVRLCKGAYKEPPDLAFPEKFRVDQNFDCMTTALFHSAIEHGSPRLSPDGKTPPIPGIATHDPHRIDYALEKAQELQLPSDCYEFQMLYGIRRDLQQRLSDQGHPVRVYVPYGTHWYPYFMRRLAERPANLWFFITSFFRN